MILGRTADNKIKIKTDGGGLRAVNCACCVTPCTEYDEHPGVGFHQISAGMASTLLSANIYADLSASSPTNSVSFQNVLFTDLSQPYPGLCYYVLTLSVGEEESGAFIASLDLTKSLGNWYIFASADVFLDPYGAIYTFDAECPVSASGSITLLGETIPSFVCAFSEGDISSFTLDIHE